ncbi:Phosphoglycerate kinase [Nymphaea thermarum]|nr:Phosphoglycerate kinase [Nymphaea thermarum]
MAAELLSFGNHQLSSIAWLRRFQASSRAWLPGITLRLFVATDTVTQRLSCGRFGVPRHHLRAQLWENAVSCHSQDNVWNAEESYSNLQVQTLRNFPKEQLHGKVVLVRFDSRILLNVSKTSNFPTDKACFTINYLHRAGAKVILTSSWDHNEGSRILSDESAADYLSELFQLRVTAGSSICGGIHLQMDGQGSGDILLIQNLKNHKEEFANCSTFARRLSMGVDIFVNDTLSQSHRILASTVGVARFAYASIAGFHFEEELSVLMKAMKPPHRPYIAVV